MKVAKKRLVTRIRKKKSVRRKITGEEKRPRVSLSRSLKHISVQAIDDAAARTIMGVSTTQKELGKLVSNNGGNTKAAWIVGKYFGDKLIAQGIKRIVFDRNGLIYHGRVKSLADGLREAGLKF